MAETEVGGMDSNRLKSIIERIERVDDEINDLKQDRKDILLEAKGAGFDPKAINHVIKQRRKNKQQREEEEMLFTTYEKAVGLD